MKRIPAIALLTIAFLSTTTAVLGQDRIVKANIPFNFTVGSQRLPAGEYTVSSPESGVVQIQSADKHLVAITPAFNSGLASDGGSKLVFKRYGDQYFLRRILAPSGENMNLDLPSWKLEKSARMRAAGTQHEGQTLVAAR